jgi:hypothetical protein
MTGEFFIKQKRAVLLGMVASTLAIAACSDNLNAGKSCPLLCPEQAITLQDTIIDAVFADTTVLGIPSIGNEVFLMLSSHGDTLDSRAIIRYDTITQTFTGAASTDSTITEVDSAELVSRSRPGHGAASDRAGHHRGVRRGHGGDRHGGVDPRRSSGRTGFSAARRSRRNRSPTLRIPISTDTRCSTASRTERSCESDSVWSRDR